MVDSSNGKTLSDYVAGSFKGSELDGLDAVISAIAEGSAHVHSQVQAAALADALGTTG